jgi:signal peptidase I
VRANGCSTMAKNNATYSRRKWWVAGLLTLIVTGLGHVYNGRFIRGLILCFIDLLLIMLFSPGLLMSFALSSSGFIIVCTALIVVILGYRTYVLIDSSIGARRQADGYSLKKYNRWYVYAGLAVLVIIVIHPLIINMSRAAMIDAYIVPTESMTPTLYIGDCIFIDKTRYCKSLPNREDVIVVSHLGKKFVKRAVGVPGDTVEIKDKVVFINDIPVEEHYTTHTDLAIMAKSVSSRDNYGPIIVSGNQVFALGDNRDNSLDSRFWGPVNTNVIEGLVKKIYFSIDLVDMKVRWKRIGVSVD